MPPVLVPGNALMYPDLQPRRFILTANSASTLSGTYTNPIGDSLKLILGIDVTASIGTSPSGPYFVSAAISGAGIFYWDSQSIGEGNGITFAWRGQLPIATGETLTVNINNSGGPAAQNCIVAWGVAGRWNGVP